MAFMNKMRERLAQSFVEALTQDKIPWKACWEMPQPQNGITGRLYHGTNSLLLSYFAMQRQLLDSRWVTFNQAKDHGWHIQKGAKGCPVEYWAYYDKEQRKLLSWSDARKILREDPDYAEKNLVLRSKTFTVFNGQEIEGIPEKESVHTRWNVQEFHNARDTLISNMGVRLMEGFSDPSYSNVSDTIFLPFEQDFFDSYSYACTMLHEAGHATGHASRLNRDLSGGFGSESYAKEELRAEIASAFTAQALGLQLTDQQLNHHMNLHKAYIQSWASVVKNNPEELFKAIKDAEKISDYLIEKGEFLPEKTANQEMSRSKMELAKSGDSTLDLNENVASSPSQPLTMREQMAQAMCRSTTAPDKSREPAQKEQDSLSLDK